MSTQPYNDHNDRDGLADRLKRFAHIEQYLRVQHILEEYDAGIEITQPMSRADVRSRCTQAVAQRFSGLFLDLRQKPRLRERYMRECLGSWEALDHEHI